MNLLDGFGMDTITMAGSLDAKLSAMKQAGFSQVMLMARDLVGHPGGVPEAVKVIQASGFGGTGIALGLASHSSAARQSTSRSMK